MGILVTGAETVNLRKGAIISYTYCFGLSTKCLNLKFVETKNFACLVHYKFTPHYHSASSAVHQHSSVSFSNHLVTKLTTTMMMMIIGHHPLENL